MCAWATVDLAENVVVFMAVGCRPGGQQARLHRED